MSGSSSAHGSTAGLEVIELLRRDRVLSVVRTSSMDDAADLCRALAAGGIRLVELTFTTPDLARHLRRAADTATETGAIVGAGTVLDLDQAQLALDAGAQFLVTPGVGPQTGEIVAAAHRAGAPAAIGALSPSEVMAALAAGADVVKIFPAHRFGPAYLKDLAGPFPGVPLLPSGGITAATGLAYLEAGAIGVCAGSNVVSAATVARAAWPEITTAAGEFVASLVR
jgi:2-dehydro-3-deoxyphosphogluconate aldolase/(4S)-4-hydroxy-2-oxoglutarate aldolase